jgi:hypothetical protein
MAENKRGRGRPAGSKGFKRAEDDVIRLGTSNGTSVTAIAQLLGRGRSAVYKRIDTLKRRGVWDQQLIDLGQLDGVSDDSRTEG